MPPFIVRVGLVLAGAWLLRDLARRSAMARDEAPEMDRPRPAPRLARGQAGRPSEPQRARRQADPPRTPTVAGVDPLVEKHRAAQFDKDWRTVDYARLSPKRPDRAGGAADPRSTWAPPPASPEKPDAPYAAHFSSFGVSTVHADVSWPTESDAPASGMLGADPASDASTGGEGADDLTRISGIGPSIERILFENGIFRFAQIAGWSDADATRMEALIGFSGRVARERWREQAQVLDKAGA